MSDGDVITDVNGVTYHLKNQECTQWLVERNSASDTCNALNEIAKSIDAVQEPRPPHSYGYFSPWMPTVSGNNVIKFIEPTTYPLKVVHGDNLP